MAVKRKLTCLQCGYAWERRVATLPKLCASCKRRDWNKPRAVKA